MGQDHASTTRLLRPSGRRALRQQASGALTASLSPQAQGVSGGISVLAILAAVQRFMLTYAGVFALVALTAAVAAGLVASDRIIMSPAARVVGQAVHRALSLVAVGFVA